MTRHPGLDPGSRFLSARGYGSRDGSRVDQHKRGEGSDFCARYGLTLLVWAEHGDGILNCIAHEKRLKRWRRDWKFALIERANPDWRDLYDLLC